MTLEATLAVVFIILLTFVLILSIVLIVANFRVDTLTHDVQDAVSQTSRVDPESVRLAEILRMSADDIRNIASILRELEQADGRLSDLGFDYFPFKPTSQTEQIHLYPPKYQQGGSA